MIKFKVGQIVRCIKNDEADATGEYGHNYYGGAGWKEGYEFKITDITIFGRPVYWRGYTNNGVYEPFLELVVDIPKVEIKKYGIALFCEQLEKK